MNNRIGFKVRGHILYVGLCVGFILGLLFQGV